MRYFYYTLFLTLFLLCGCKKDSVDATNTRTLQSSINDMQSSLPTLQQVKFNEALYILKTFGVQGANDFEKLKNLGTLINDKKIPEILTMADDVAAKNSIAWTSSGPPSLGEMNIFGNENAKEFDPNDVGAASLDIVTREISRDSILGPKAIQIVPRLVDGRKNPVTFSGAALETQMDVYSNGSRLYSSKNLMTGNSFKGFTLRFASLPKNRVVDNKVDIKITVKTSKKTFQFIKSGVQVNPKALLMPSGTPSENPANTGTETVTPEVNTATTGNSAADAPEKSPSGEPKNTVSKFLGNLSAQNLKGAYDSAENPNWGSYDAFSNPTSGFGAVKNLKVKNISQSSKTDNSATVNATYDVTDNAGNTTPLKVTFGLKNVSGEWKITSYKIN